MVTLTGSPALKVQVMCEGIRYTAALGEAAAHSMPNYYPYRFKEGEHDPTGRGIATIPYLINTRTAPRSASWATAIRRGTSKAT